MTSSIWRKGTSFPFIWIDHPSTFFIGRKQCCFQFYSSVKRKGVLDLTVQLRQKTTDYKVLPELKIGDPLLNINYLKESKDPILQDDKAYPEYIWQALEPKPPAYLTPHDQITTKKQLRQWNILKMKMNNVKAKDNKL